LNVHNIPRMARLCLVIYEVSRNVKQVRARRLKDTQKDFIIPLYWVNTTLFDYKNQFKNGGQTLYSWNYTEDSDSDELLHPLGTVEPNPRTAESTSITLMFHNYSFPENHVYLYPDQSEILRYANSMDQDQKDKQPATFERSIISILQPFMLNDRISDIFEHERKEIWDRRYECLKYIPNGLPCLLHCVEWNNRDVVAEVVKILLEWPKEEMSVERTLELLDFAYADCYVRRFAVECLDRKIKDEDLQLYLLQLVQAIKHESYLYCDLVKFLLKRALNNQRIGHFLFWHLRSEIHVPSVEVRFSLILEAYLRSSKEHISILMRQHLW
jgi:phosphatidylinositol-4,5-bisphosphate 3-kinase catalytic subunit alpha/beta/delta